jgi:hypothetical protein
VRRQKPLTGELLASGPQAATTDYVLDNVPVMRENLIRSCFPGRTGTRIDRNRDFEMRTE